MMVNRRTAGGDAATQVVLQTFRANGRFLAAGDLLAGEQGLTAARWQVLGAIALAGRPLTVPQIARRMGVSRQSVQVSVNRMLADGVVVAEQNPDHRRSLLIRLTKSGVAKYEALQRQQAPWANELAAGVSVTDLATTARVLEDLANKLEALDGQSGRRE
jgi:DNA-binding MarR family transcriptional regulator